MCGLWNYASSRVVAQLGSVTAHFGVRSKCSGFGTARSEREDEAILKVKTKFRQCFPIRYVVPLLQQIRFQHLLHQGRIVVYSVEVLCISVILHSHFFKNFKFDVAVR